MTTQVKICPKCGSEDIHLDKHLSGSTDYYYLDRCGHCGEDGYFTTYREDPPPAPVAVAEPEPEPQPVQPPADNDNDLHGEFSAQVWAERFVMRVKENHKIPYSEGAMIAWFAGAIMAGYDHARNGFELVGRFPLPGSKDQKYVLYARVEEFAE